MNPGPRTCLSRAAACGAALAMVLVATAALAAHPMATDDTGTQGVGHVELELGAQRAAEEGARVSEVGAQVSVGLAERLDVILRPTALQLEPGDGSGSARGIGDTDLGFKWRFAEGPAGSLALRGDVFTPTGNEARGLGASGAAYRVLLIATTDLGAWALHGNAGYTRLPAEDDARRGIGFVSAAAVWNVTEALRLSLELTATSLAARDIQRWALASRIGAMVDVTQSLRIDAGFERRLDTLGPSSVLLAGLTYRW